MVINVNNDLFLSFFLLGLRLVKQLASFGPLGPPIIAEAVRTYKKGCLSLF